jgi:hypothetical protein
MIVLIASREDAPQGVARLEGEYGRDDIALGVPGVIRPQQTQAGY